MCSQILQGARQGFYTPSLVRAAISQRSTTLIDLTYALTGQSIPRINCAVAMFADHG